MLITMLRNHFHRGVEFPIYNNYDLPEDEARWLVESGAAAFIGTVDMVTVSDKAGPPALPEPPEERKPRRKSK